MPKKIIIKPDVILRMSNMYTDDRLRVKDIAQYYPYSQSLVRKTLINNGVNIRPLSMALRNLNRLPMARDVRENKYLHHSKVMKNKWKAPIFLKKMRDTRNYWSEEDTQTLKMMYFDSCLSLLGISEKLNRTPYAVKARLQNLGIQRTKSDATKNYHKREQPWNNPEYRIKTSKAISIAASKRWRDLEFVRKMALIWRFKPSGSEKLREVQGLWSMV